MAASPCCIIKKKVSSCVLPLIMCGGVSSLRTSPGAGLQFIVQLVWSLEEAGIEKKTKTRTKTTTKARTATSRRKAAPGVVTPAELQGARGQPESNLGERSEQFRTTDSSRATRTRTRNTTSWLERRILLTSDTHTGHSLVADWRLHIPDSAMWSLETHFHWRTQSRMSDFSWTSEKRLGAIKACGQVTQQVETRSATHAGRSAGISVGPQSLRASRSADVCGKSNFLDSTSPIFIQKNAVTIKRRSNKTTQNFSRTVLDLFEDSKQHVVASSSTLKISQWTSPRDSGQAGCYEMETGTVNFHSKNGRSQERGRTRLRGFLVQRHHQGVRMKWHSEGSSTLHFCWQKVWIRPEKTLWRAM